MSKLKDLRVLTTAAMLAAIAVVLGFFKIPISNLIELRFQSFPIAISGALFGPIVGAIVGVISDVGGYIAKPTGAFFPGFTISAAITGIIFGLIIKSESQKWALLGRIAIAMTINTIVTGLILNTLWLSMLYGNPFNIVFVARLPKELIMLPINIAILYVILVPVKNAATRILGDLA
ncbi:MAG: folate family ECF transporter S component, partial [Prevotellaceae bacterium]|nr:folate family ECF transporter S component [Candidatus Faecinaster equi]